MAPLPVNSTGRYKVLYTVSGHQHNQDWRSGSSPASVTVQLDAIWTALGSKLYACTIDDLQFSAAGTNVFNPVTSGFVGNTYGSGTGSPGETPYFISAIGRSTDGRRVRAYWYGAKSLGGDYRYVSGEDGAVDATIDALQSAGAVFQTIGGLTPVWKTYMNAGVNAYWQRKTRP